MTMAISKAAERRREGGHLRLHRQHLGLGRRLRRPRRHGLRGARARGQDRDGQAGQAIVHGAQLLQVDGNFDDCLEIARELAEHYPVTWSTRSTPTASRARRPRPSRSSTCSATRPTSTACPSATPATSRPTGAATASTTADGAAAKLPARCWASRPPAPRRSSRRAGQNPETIATAIRIGNPASWEQALAAPRRVRRPLRLGDRRADPRGLPACSRRARASSSSRPRRHQRRGAAQARRGRAGSTRATRRLHRHRPRPQGPAVGPRAARRAGHRPSKPTVVRGRLGLGLTAARCAHDRSRRAAPYACGFPRPRRTSARASTPRSRARPLRRRRVHVTDALRRHGRRARRGRRRGADRWTAPRRAPSAAFDHSASRCRRPRARSAQRHPARPRPRLLGRGDRRRHHGRQGPLEGGVDIDCADAALLDARRPSSRVTPTTSPRRSSAGSRSPGPPPTAPAEKLLDAGGVSARRVRARGARCPPRPAPAARVGAATRMPSSTSSRSALLVAALTQSPELLLGRPRTSCTRTTGERDARDHALIQILRANGLAAVVSGAGPSILVLASDPAAASVRRRALVTAHRLDATAAVG